MAASIGLSAPNLPSQPNARRNLHKDQAALKNEQAALTFAERQVSSLKAQRASAELTIAQASASRDQAKVNWERTQIHAPVDGWVTNLLAHLGDYVTVGKNVIALVDAGNTSPLRPFAAFRSRHPPLAYPSWNLSRCTKTVVRSHSFAAGLDLSH